MKDFETQGQVVKGTPIVAGSVMAGVVVKDGAKEPYITSADNLKQAILDAEGLSTTRLRAAFILKR